MSEKECLNVSPSPGSDQIDEYIVFAREGKWKR